MSESPKLISLPRRSSQVRPRALECPGTRAIRRPAGIAVGGGGGGRFPRFNPRLLIRDQHHRLFTRTRRQRSNPRQAIGLGVGFAKQLAFAGKHPNVNAIQRLGRSQ